MHVRDSTLLGVEKTANPVCPDARPRSTDRRPRALYEEAADGVRTGVRRAKWPRIVISCVDINYWKTEGQSFMHAKLTVAYQNW